MIIHKLTNYPAWINYKTSSVMRTLGKDCKILINVNRMSIGLVLAACCYGASRHASAKCSDHTIKRKHAAAR